MKHTELDIDDMISKLENCDMFTPAEVTAISNSLKVSENLTKLINTPDFSIGDEVKIIGGQPEHRHPFGSIGQIVEKCESNTPEGISTYYGVCSSGYILYYYGHELLKGKTMFVSKIQRKETDCEYTS